MRLPTSTSGELKTQNSSGQRKSKFLSCLIGNAHAKYTLLGVLNLFKKSWSLVLGLTQIVGIAMRVAPTQLGSRKHHLSSLYMTS